MVTHRIGIIGLGTVGTRFVEQFNLHPLFDLVTAWDPSVAACAANESDVKIASDADSVIAEVDAVYIAVPPMFHKEYVEKCLAAKKGIFCEKPLGISVEDSEKLVASVEASGLPAGVNFVFSAAPSATHLQVTRRIVCCLRLLVGEMTLLPESERSHSFTLKNATGGQISFHVFVHSRVN